MESVPSTPEKSAGTTSRLSDMPQIKNRTLWAVPARSREEGNAQGNEVKKAMILLERFGSGRKKLFRQGYKTESHLLI